MDLSDLRLDLHFPCSLGDLGHYSVMPSLRADMLQREYIEPVRDRDKNWVMHSQRKILNQPREAELLPLGIYRKKDRLGPLVWSPALQTLTRKIKILTTTAVISHTYCIVEVYGFGLSGRIFSEGSNNLGRYLIIEVYSAWNSLKYVALMTALTLRAVLHDDVDLLKSGLKNEAIDSILKRLYFQYTLTLAYPSMSTTTSSNDTSTTQICRHIDAPHLPDGIPQTIPDIITFIQSDSSSCSSVNIKLAQELFIDTSEIEAGPSLSRRNYKRRLIEQESEYILAQQAWQTTPLRHRGLVHSTARRTSGKMMVLSSYKLPKRPGSLSLKCHFSIECTALSLALSLSTIGQAFQVFMKPFLWSQALLQHVVKSTSNSIKIRIDNEIDYQIRFKESQSSSQEASRMISCYPFKKMYSKQSYMHSFENIRHHVQQYNRSACLLQHSTDRDGKTSFDHPPMYFIKPRREVGKGVRICSRSVRILGVYAILSLYLESALEPLEVPIPALLDTTALTDDEGRADHDAMNTYFSSLVTYFDVMAEVYIPTSQILSNVTILASSSNATVHFTKDDVFRLVDQDVEIMTTLLRVAYLSYHHTASAGMKEQSTRAWGKFIRCLAKTAQWRVHEAGAVLPNAVMGAEDRLFISSSHLACVMGAVRVVVQWPAEIFRRAVKIEDEDDRKPTQLMQVVMWQRGASIGIVAYHRLLHEIYFAEDLPSAQASQIEALRYLSDEERVLTLSIYCSLQVKYYDRAEDDGDGGRGIFIVSDVSGPRFDVLADDYEERTKTATDKAGDEVLQRFINARA